MSKNKYIVSAKITGTAWCEVEADSQEEAIELSKTTNWEINDWDLNTDGSRGGYIDAEEVK